MTIGVMSWLYHQRDGNIKAERDYITMENVRCPQQSLQSCCPNGYLDVGVPRDYKWINTISLAKSMSYPLISYAGVDQTVWEQLHIARTFNMNQVWILNVGDLKLLEVPLDYFLTIAYDADRWPRNSLTEWLEAWAARDFGEEVKEEAAWVMGTFSVGFSDTGDNSRGLTRQRYVSRIKPELLNSTLWSIENYDE